MILSALSFLVAAQSSSEVPEGLMNNPVVSSCMTSNKIASNETEKNKICQQTLVLSTSILHRVSLKSIRQFKPFYM